jgi:hypothetical protein
LGRVDQHEGGSGLAAPLDYKELRPDDRDGALIPLLNGNKHPVNQQVLDRADPISARQMTTSDRIRALAAEGVPTAEIARRLGIRYQHAYGVIRGNSTQPIRTPEPMQQHTGKPALHVETLAAAGFQHVGKWQLSEDSQLVIDRKLPKEIGVYAFAIEDSVLYVGVATMGLAKRLYFYGKPGATQRTSIRINGMIAAELKSIPCVDVYAAFPPDLEWNGLPVHGSAGLELGLIKKYALPWNMRSAG